MVVMEMKRFVFFGFKGKFNYLNYVVIYIFLMFYLMMEGKGYVIFVNCFVLGIKLMLNIFVVDDLCLLCWMVVFVIWEVGYDVIEVFDG